MDQIRTCLLRRSAIAAIMLGVVVASASQFVFGGVASEWTFDLDADGTDDTDLVIAACTIQENSSCLFVTSDITDDREIILAPFPNVCSGNVQGRRLELIGDHNGDGLQEVAVIHCERQSPTVTPPALTVVDVSTGELAGRALAPSTHVTAYIEYPTDSDGRKYPFLAPSYGDGQTTGGSAVWGFLCLFRPDLPSSSQCGPGFVDVNTRPVSPPTSYFREVGGYLQDLDDDGWEDITLIYHRRVLAISTGEARVLGMTEYDVAAATEPTSPALFHAGRNYGTHSAVTTSGGPLRTIMVGGQAVGAFSDPYCNVSRFVAVLESAAGKPDSRELRWSHYFGFHSAIFSVFDPVHADDPSGVVSRPANHQNHCIHRFSDSRSVMDEDGVIIFNYFTQKSVMNSCLREQYQLYLPPTWTAAKQAAWNACINQNLNSPGVWGVKVLRESDGTLLAVNPNAYIWGSADSLVAGGERVYLVESLPGTMRFNLSDRTRTKLEVWSMSGGVWEELRGEFPVPGRPMIRQVPPSGAKGVGSYTYFAELTLKDVDNDGLDEVRLANGSWVGYSPGQGFVVK